MPERSFPRHGYPVFYDGAPSGDQCVIFIIPVIDG